MMEWRWARAGGRPVETRYGESGAVLT